MKKSISASPALLAATMMVTLLFGCGEGIERDTGSQLAQLNQGQCNAIVARAMGSAQECFRSGCEPGDALCREATDVLSEFFGNQECAAAAVADELNGLPSGNPSDHPAGPNAGELKHIGEVICRSVQQCDLCQFLPQEPPGQFCPGICD